MSETVIHLKWTRVAVAKSVRSFPFTLQGFLSPLTLTFFLLNSFNKIYLKSDLWLLVRQNPNERGEELIKLLIYSHAMPSDFVLTTIKLYHQQTKASATMQIIFLVGLNTALLIITCKCPKARPSEQTFKRLFTTTSLTQLLITAAKSCKLTLNYFPPNQRAVFVFSQSAVSLNPENRIFDWWPN